MTHLEFLQIGQFIDRSPYDMIRAGVIGQLLSSVLCYNCQNLNTVYTSIYSNVKFIVVTDYIYWIRV